MDWRGSRATSHVNSTHGWRVVATTNAPQMRYVSAPDPRLFIERHALNGPLTCLRRSDSLGVTQAARGRNWLCKPVQKAGVPG
jgi:hypothetical protein